MLPDDRIPSRRDAEVANEVPDSALLAAFKKALLTDLSGLEAQDLLQLDLNAGVSVKPAKGDGKPELKHSLAI